MKISCNYKWKIVLVFFLSLTLNLQSFGDEDEVEDLVPSGDSMPLISPAVAEVAREMESEVVREEAPSGIAAKCSDNSASLSDCEKSQCILRDFQGKIFNLSHPDDGVPLKELMASRDDILSKMNLLQGLLKIWDDYYSYLGDSAELTANSKLRTPGPVQEKIQGLLELKTFINKNQSAVMRHQVMAESMSLLDLDAMGNLSSDEDKFNYIKNQFVGACAQAENQSFYICNEAKKDSRFWDSLSFSPSITNDPRTASELMNKFSNTLANIDKVELLDIPAINRNLSNLFVDIGNNDLLVESDFVDGFTTIINQSIETCREAALLPRIIGGETVEQSASVNCFDRDLSQIPGVNEDQLKTVQNSLAKMRGVAPGSLNSLASLTDAYLKNSEDVLNSHAESAGGTIQKLAELSQSNPNIATDIRQGGNLLMINDDKAPTSYLHAREEFKDLSKERLVTLSRQLTSIQKNKKLYQDFNVDGLDVSLDIGKKANDNLRELFEGFDEDIFTTYDGQDDKGEPELHLNLQNVNGGLKALMDSFSQEDVQRKFSDLNASLEAVNSKINKVKGYNPDPRNTDQPLYQQLSQIKNYLWSPVKNNCSRTSGDFDIDAGGFCEFNREDSGIQSLIKVGDEFISHQTEEESKQSLNDLNGLCQRIISNNYEDEAMKELKSELTSKNICRSISTDTRVEERRRLERAAEDKLDHNEIFEFDDEGKLIGSYKPKSNFNLVLTQAAYTVNENLPFWFIQLPQMGRWTDSMRTAGFQEKTALAYRDAQIQSWQNMTTCGFFGCFYNTTMMEGVSPTFGNAGFNFSTTANPLNL